MILRIRSTLKEGHVNIILHVLFSLLNRHSLLNNMFKIQQHYIRCDTQIPVGCWDRKPFFKIPRKHKVSLWGPTLPSLFILILSCLAMPINLPMLQDSLSHNKQDSKACGAGLCPTFYEQDSVCGLCNYKPTENDNTRSTTGLI